MKKLNLTLTVFVILSVLSGCAGTISSVNNNQSLFYEMTEKQADQIVASSLASEFPGTPISRIEFPNKGYQAIIRFGIDSHTIVAYFIPANGSGKKGFVFEVNHSGTMPISGNNRAKGTFKRIIERANLEFKSHTISGYGN